MKYTISKNNIRVLQLFRDNELKIIELGMNGKKNIEIAEEVGYSERTVMRIFKKLRQRFDCLNDRQLFGVLGSMRTLWND